jgi:protein phosphatase 1 regulatory subunit 7
MDITPEPSKTARLVVVSDEDNDNDNDVSSHEGSVANDDLLAAFPDDTEVRSTLSSYIINNNHQEIDLARSRLSSCARLGLPRFAGHLKNICLRANFIDELDKDAFEPLEKLEELDLYDNRLSELGPALNGKQALRQVI